MCCFVLLDLLILKYIKIVLLYFFLNLEIDKIKFEGKNYVD